MALTDLEIRNAKPGKAGRKLADQDGLYLFISPAGGKLWRWDYKLDGTRRTASLGAYDGLGIKAARERLAEAKGFVRAGIDPKEGWRQAAASHRIEAAKLRTFGEMFDEWAKGDFVTMSKGRQIAYRLGFRHCAPLHDLPLQMVDALTVLGLLRDLLKSYKPTTVAEARNVISRVCSYGIVAGMIAVNPADQIKAHGFKLGGAVSHFAAAIEGDELGDVLRTIAGHAGSRSMGRLLGMLPYVLTRPSELRLAQWHEFDLDNGVWTVPLERMKNRRAAGAGDHFVPLARQMVERLRAWRDAADPAPGDYVFPGRSAGKPLHRAAVAGAMLDLGLADVQTAHGFRASASSLLTESRLWSRDAIEFQLCHSIEKDANRRVRMSYMRTPLRAERTEMLQYWADFIDDLRANPAGAELAEIRRAA